MCFIFLFLNLADVAINKSILLNDWTKLENTIVILTISIAPTDVAKILSLGKLGLGSMIYKLLKLKFFIALAQAPIFSDN